MRFARGSCVCIKCSRGFLTWSEQVRGLWMARVPAMVRALACFTKGSVSGLFPLVSRRMRPAGWTGGEGFEQRGGDALLEMLNSFAVTSC